MKERRAGKFSLFYTPRLAGDRPYPKHSVADVDFDDSVAGFIG
jgi:hypothetical protein